MKMHKKLFVTILSAVLILAVVIIGYFMRYRFLPIDYLTKKAEDACIEMHDNNADEAKKCICHLRSTLVVVPEKEVRPLIVKTINKDKIGVKRLLASNVTFMNAMLAVSEEEECNSSKIRFHNGVVKTYHQNGAVLQEQHWKDDKPIRIVSYYDNGNKEADISTIDFDEKGNAIQHGVSMRYYKNGNLESEGDYVNGKLEGTLRKYYENGYLANELTYENGVRNGNQKLYYEDGNLFMEGNMQNGHFAGLHRVYYENGNIKQESNMKDGKTEGITKYYCDDGTLRAEANYKNDKIDGLTKTFHGDGSFCETMNDNGKMQSRKCYDKDGNEINLNGLVKFYHKNGKLASETNYVNGKKEGASNLYYTNGTLQEKATFKNNELDGELKQFDLSGKLIIVFKYKNGELVK